MKNKKILFFLPKTKWWPYYIYKELVNYLNKEYWYNIEIYNSNKDWLKIHFLNKFNVIFSVIPFLFNPFWLKKKYHIIVWNFEKEKLKNSIWNKLLYLTYKNIKSSKKTILMNNYLLKEIPKLNNFKEKIEIIPNYINYKKFEEIQKYNIERIEKLDNENITNILTVTWFKFYDKAKWVLNLKNIINNYARNHSDKQIIWNIAWNFDNDIFKKIKEQFDNIKTENNLKINWLWWINEEQLLEQYKINDIFLYWTYLDVFPTVLLEAGAAWLPMLVNNFESFYENIPEKLICKSEEEMLNKLENIDLKESQRINIENSKKYDIDKIAKQFINLIEN